MIEKIITMPCIEYPLSLATSLTCDSMVQVYSKSWQDEADKFIIQMESLSAFLNVSCFSKKNRGREILADKPDKLDELVDDKLSCDHVTVNRYAA